MTEPRPRPPASPETEKLEIVADSVVIDVAEIYRNRGHVSLPPTPTIAPWQLSSIVGGDTINRIWWLEPFNGELSRALDNNEPVHVRDGMRFTSVPRGQYVR